MTSHATPTFTLATAEHVELIAALVQEFYIVEHITVAAHHTRAALDELLAHRALGAIFLVSLEDEVVGYGVVTFGFSLEFRGRFALLDELYLRERVRGRGLGAACLAFAERFCEHEGVAAIRLEVAHDNARARSVYQRAGYAGHNRDLLTKMLVDE